MNDELCELKKMTLEERQQAREDAIRRLNRYAYVTKKEPLNEYDQSMVYDVLHQMAERNGFEDKFEELVLRSSSDTLTMLYKIVSTIDTESDLFEKEKLISALDIINFDKSKNRVL